MLSQQDAAGAAHAVGNGVRHHADLIGHLICLQHSGTQHTEGLEIHGVAQTEYQFVPGHGNHPPEHRAQEGRWPVKQLLHRAKEGLPRGEGVGHMSHQTAEGGDEGGDGRAPHTQSGKPQLSENQQVIQQGVETVGTQAKEHRDLCGLHASIHESVPVDQCGEKIGKGADGNILLRQFDQMCIVAEKGQKPCAAQLGQQEEGQRDAYIQQKLQAKAALQVSGVSGAEELGGEDQNAGVDAEAYQHQKVVDLCGNGHGAHTAHMADHHGVQEGGTLVQRLLQADGQRQTQRFFVKGR